MKLQIAYSYIRMSTDQQIKGDSLRRQLELSRQWAAANELVLDETLRDIGVSAYKGKNRKEGALGIFLDMVDTGRVQRGSYLLIESLDRLSRDEVLEALSLFLEIIKAGIVIVTLADNQTYSQESVGNDWSKLIISLTIMARAHEESLRKSERISAAFAAKRAKAQRGEAGLSATCPGWIDARKTARDQYEFTLNKHAAAIRRIFEMKADGMGYISIVQRLNTEGVPTMRTGTSGWTETVIARIINRRDALGEHQPCRLVDGKRVPEGDPIPGYYPAAVDEALYQRAQATKRLSASNPGRKGTTFANLFAGMAKCEHCRSTMTLKTVAVKRSKTPYLVCSSYMRKRGCILGKRYFHYKNFERLILDNVNEFMFADIMRASSSEDIILDLERRIAETRLRVEDLEKRVSRLMLTLETCDEALISGLLANMKARKVEKEEASRSLARLEHERFVSMDTARNGDIKSEIDKLRSCWTTATPLERYAMRSRVNVALRTFIDFITFNSCGNMYTVIILGGLRVYRFADGGLIGKVDLAGALGDPSKGFIDPEANANDGISRKIINERLDAILKLKSLAD